MKGSASIKNRMAMMQMNADAIEAVLENRDLDNHDFCNFKWGIQSF